MSFVYSVTSELRLAAKGLLDRRTADNPFLKRMPMRETQYAQVTWEREDSTFGLMQGRGYNNAAPQVPGLGSKRYTKMPGVYGEKMPIDEYELTVRAAPATYGIPQNIDDLIAKRNMQIMTRAYNRMIFHVVTLITTGRYVAKDAKGSVIDEDAFTPQIYTPQVLWSTLGSSTPWADFQNIALLDLGFSVEFNNRALAVMNQKTFNYYRQNQNQTDIAGRKTKFGATYNNLGDLNQLHQDDGLPNIQIWNESYLDDNKAAQRYMPDGYMVVMGYRMDNSAIGEFLMTRNINNPNSGSQFYYQVIDKQEGQPRELAVDAGYNGGLAIYMPECIVVAKVA